MSKHTGGPNEPHVGQNSWNPNSFYLKLYCHFVIIDDDKRKCLFFILTIVTHMSGTYGSYLVFRNENEALIVYHQVLAVYHTIFTTFFSSIYLFTDWLIDWFTENVFWKYIVCYQCCISWMIDIQLYNITERTMWTKIKYASYLLLSKTRLNHTFLVNLLLTRTLD